ncbi:Cation transport ATPase [Candidatus Arthromitus sp. SFB-3]|nr:Cation transport ATPase [Candidatus Arthromitus sp. SFB-3]
MKKVLKITGMTCAACSSSIEKSLSRKKGVNNVVVNLSTEKLTINFDEKEINLDQIESYVIKLGYGIDKLSEDNYYDRENEYIRNILKRFIISLVFTIPLLYISMGHMFSYKVIDFFDHMSNPFNFTIAQLILVMPVMIVGFPFFKKGIKSLINLKPNMDSLITIGTFDSLLSKYFLASTPKG